MAKSIFNAKKYVNVNKIPPQSVSRITALIDHLSNKVYEVVS